MFDLSWGKMIIIGVMALVLIPPKDLPGTLRALGQMVGKIKRMAGEFRSQFDDAMRDADIASVKKEFDSMNEAASSVSTFNPIESIRNEIKTAVNPGETATADAASAMPVQEPDIPLPDAVPPVDHAAFGEAKPVEAAADELPAPKPKTPRKPRVKAAVDKPADGGADA
ncbi:MAG: Sec-independent protein translocase protein TatB [Beijerinckiaceae bacterium]